MKSLTPLIFPAAQNAKLRKLVAAHPEITIVDAYEDQLTELFNIRFPKKINQSKERGKFIGHEFGREPESTGNWVYFPWRNSVVHLLEESLFHEVRTARNFPLISKKDQSKFMDSCVAIVGLSVGSSLALTIAQSGGAGTMKLADFDSLSLSNLNRIRASTIDLGLSKTTSIARQIYELNPYAKLILYPEGLTPDNLEDFLTAGPQPNLIIDEADDIATKQFLRLACRALRLPLMMTTDNGLESNTRVIRFDRSPDAGNMAEVPSLSFAQVIRAFKIHEPAHLNNRQKLNLISDLVGIDDVSYEMQVGSIMTAEGQTAGWPQVAMTVFLGGSLGAYAAQQVLTGYDSPADQTSFSLPSHLDPHYLDSHRIKQRKTHTQIFKRYLKSHR